MTKFGFYICLGYTLITFLGFAYIASSEDNKLLARIEALEKREVKDKRLDEVIMKGDKDVTRIQVYDSVSAIVVKSIQEQTKNGK